LGSLVFDDQSLKVNMATEFFGMISLKAMLKVQVSKQLRTRGLSGGLSIESLCLYSLRFWCAPIHMSEWDDVG
jgi:hypothetical protein